MRLVHWFNWFRRGPNPDASDALTRSVDEAIAAGARRLRAVDPETDNQWQRMKSGLTSNENIAVASGNFVNKGSARPAMAFALATAVLIIVGVIWLSRPSIKTYETMKGQHSAIMLPDSTEVTLNHTSELTVSHSAANKARQVTLKGEAFFDVRHTGIPFILATDVGTIRVLGTQFNVRMRDGQLEVGVVRGSVQVAISRNGVDTSLILSEEQIVACTMAGFQGMPTNLPSSDYPGWMHGRIMFYRTDLRSACRDLESQFDIRITIQRPQLNSATITGTLDGQNVEKALSTLAQLTGSNVRREDSGYTLY